MGPENHAHRSGSLKQTNKSHKTGRHRSKGAIDNATKGKTAVQAMSHRHKAQQRKEQRRNQSNQIRRNKRDEIMEKKRQLGSVSGIAAPFLVCILPLHSQIDPNSALSILENCDEQAIVNKSEASGITYITIPRFKQRFAFIVPPVGKGSELEVLDYLKVCDTTILLTSAAMGEEESDMLDRWGHKIFNFISAQGIPTPIVTLMDLESINPKKKHQAKVAVQKYIQKLLPEERVMQLDTNAEGLNIMRRIGGQKKNVLYNKNNHPHIFGEKTEYTVDPVNQEVGTLKVTGFLRGKPLDVNGLVHIPGLGDFQVNQIDSIPDPYKLERKADDMESERVLCKADPSKQTSLQKENIPNAMDAEQTWPTEEEIEMANEETKKSKKVVKRVPKGMSDYQACWIPETKQVDEESDDDDDDEEDEEDGEDFMSCEDDDSEGDMHEAQSQIDDHEFETVSVSEGPVNDEKYDMEMDLQEERETLAKIKEARADQLFPDERDTPLDVDARIRFQKYRGLESFRTSPWDVKENLPSDYARIFQFQNFDRTKRRVINEAADIDDGAVPGSYIRVHVANVPQSQYNSYRSSTRSNNVILYGMLPHEHQMSVMNCIFKRIPDSEIPIKSKEKMIVQCGYRRFIVSPIYSQHTNGGKHKFEKFFRPHSTVVATFYAPIQFPPAPVMCFKENPDTSLALVARGCVMSCNPDRIILKRVVLSGHPMRINVRSATIRYMFFNKLDVDYFMPIKLRTKCGRIGHIKESLGTHGHMKCVFDGQLRSYDTVFMYLYKRVFPKWNYEELIVEEVKDGGSRMDE